MLRRETPQVLLFDLESAGPNGESVLSRLRRAFPETRILVIVEKACDANVARALRAGAWGLVDTQTSFETLMRAIQSVAQGEVWANRLATAQALEYLAHFDAPLQDGSALSTRELEIKDCVGHGLRNKEIAHLLNISEKTVKSHLNNIFRKLKLEGRIALALLAHTHRQQHS
jgi:DNA-binding NarL/FixJ family response regulator